MRLTYLVSKRASIPDLPEPENVKTYSFNNSGQLHFFFQKFHFCSLFSFSSIVAMLVWVNNRGLIQEFKLTHSFFCGADFPSIAHLLCPIRLTLLALANFSYLLWWGCSPADSEINIVIDLQYRMSGTNIHSQVSIFLFPSCPSPTFLLSFATLLLCNKQTSIFFRFSDQFGISLSYAQ